MDEAGDSTFPNWPEFRRLFAYDNLLGKVLQGRYEIVRRLGAGGMGVVFLARHVHLDKLFALKIISPRFLDEPEIGQRFLLEARAASKIDHPNVVSITDFGPPEEGPAFFVMEYLEGEDLAHLLAREGPLPWSRALPMVTQIARALAAAHQRGVVHRDIKPQNCFRVTRDDNPDFIKVLDFGLAKVLSGTGKSAWTVGGSPGYIAPEIYRGGRTDHRVDIFALGVLLHALLLGRLPAQTPADVESPGGPPPQLSDLPAGLRAVLERATAEDPERRYPSVEALLNELEATRTKLERRGAGSRDMLLKNRPARPRRRWLLAGAAGLAGALTLAWVSQREPAGSEPSPVQPETAIAARASDTPSIPDAPAHTPSEPGSASPSKPLEPSPPEIVGSTDAPRPAATDSAGPRRPAPAAFDEPAARAVLQRSAGRIAACKADSSVRGMATTVRLPGSVRVSARGRGAAELPPGYDVAACIERVVATLRFRSSAEGGRFDYVFLL